MQTKRKQPNRNKTNLLIDLAIFVAFLVIMAPRFSGIATHEWLSIAFAAVIVTHLLLHWNWIVGIAKNFFTRARWSSRLNYGLNLLLFMSMTVVIFTGLMFSEVALPQLGIHVASGGAWRRLHETSANLTVIIVGLHLAIHWQWIVNMTKRFVIRPLTPRRRTRQLEPQTYQVGEEA